MLSSCSKGKECMCEYYDIETGEYEGSRLYSDFKTCEGTQHEQNGSSNDLYYYCYDYNEYLNSN